MKLTIEMVVMMPRLAMHPFPLHILLFTLMCLIFSQATFAEVKLGIGLKQGYSAAYISDIDPFGSGAASGFMDGDQIKEVNGVAIWFVDQAERMLTYNIDKGQPFIVMVERKGGLNRVVVDASKPSRSFPRRQGVDVYSNCYMAPDLACLESVVDNRKPIDQSPSAQISNHLSKVEHYVLLGKLDKANATYKAMEALFFRDKSLINIHAHNVFAVMNMLGKEPDKRHFEHIYRNTRKRVSDLSRSANMFAEYGAKNYAEQFYREAVQLINKNSKELASGGLTFSRTLAYLEEKDQLVSYLQSSHYSSEEKNRLLSRYIVELVKLGKKGAAQEAVNLIYSVKRSWTNDDYVIFVQLFQKLHMQDAAWNTIKRLEAFYESGKDNIFIQPLTARSLVKAYGAIGSIHNGRKYIDRHFSDMPLEMLMSLAIEAANSRSSAGLALQYYKDLPKLVDEVYAGIKAATPEQRKKLSKVTVEQFYELLAAYLPANPSFTELTPFVRNQYGFTGVIDAFIEVRKFNKAEEWTNAVEKQFGNTYRHGDILAAVGALASSQQEVDHFKRTAEYSERGFRLTRPYVKRLYWNGYFDKALAEFNTMSEKEKAIAVLTQLPFVVGCQECTI